MPLGELAGEQVCGRLRGAEREHEGEDRRGRAEAEVLLADDREHAALQPDHRAHERVQPDEQAELGRVRAQAEPHRQAHAGTTALPERFAATIPSCPAGRGGMSATSAAANASASVNASIALWARSNPI